MIWIGNTFLVVLFTLSCLKSEDWLVLRSIQSYEADMNVIKDN